jgi:general secretion pathway protein H
VISTARQHRESLSGRRGVTLVEILLVLTLVALIAGGVMNGTGMLGSSRQRGAATLVLVAVRLAMTEANSSGLPVRIVFDMDQHRISLEATRARMLRTETEDDDSTAGAAAATEAEQLASEEAKRIVEGPREPPARFEALPALGVDPDGAGVGRALEGDVRFVSVHTEHDTAPRSKGRAYLYFWPGGGTEKAIITLGRPGDVEPLSVVVSALTGRAQIVKGEVDFDRPELETDFGEREVE